MGRRSRHEGAALPANTVEPAGMVRGAGVEGLNSPVIGCDRLAKIAPTLPSSVDKELSGLHRRSSCKPTRLPTLSGRALKPALNASLPFMCSLHSRASTPVRFLKQSWIEHA